MLRSGVARMLWASLCFSLMSVVVKALAARLPTAEIVLFRSVLGVPALAWALSRRGVPLWPRRPKLVFARGSFGSLSMGLWFWALGQLTLGDAIMLQQVQPVFVALLAPLLLGERTQHVVMACVAVSLVGVAAILRPTLAVGNLAGLAMLLSALASSFAVLSVRRLSADDDPLVIVHGFAVVSSVLALPFFLANPVMPTPLEALGLCAAAALATAGQVLMTGAYALESAAVVAASSYASVVLAAVFGFLFFAEQPTGWSYVGGGLIVSAGVTLLWSRRPRPESSGDPT